MNAGQNTIIINNNVIINASKKQPTLLNACEGKKIVVGEGCLFSNSIEIHTTDYHKIFYSEIQSNFPEDVIIGQHVWIGLQTLVLKGVTIADGCMVGARSLLTREYTEVNSLIAGHPARVVKNNITWNHEPTKE